MSSGMVQVFCPRCGAAVEVAPKVDWVGQYGERVEVRFAQNAQAKHSCAVVLDKPAGSS